MAGRRITGEPDCTVFFDGRELPAVRGEPLSATLLANGVRTVALGIGTGRPRGVVGIGTAEPGAQVRVDAPAPRAMAPATRVESRGGLRAFPLAGRAPLPSGPAPQGDSRWAHCDVLVVGAGPAGLAAACAAAQEGARVMVCDEGAEPGGDAVRLDAETTARTARMLASLQRSPDVLLLARATATGHYDHGEVVVLERRDDSTTMLWRIRTRRVVLATGATERPFVFEGNDLPGVMLAGAVASYVRGYGVLAGERIVVSGCHDEALAAAAVLHDAGADLAAVADARPSPGAAVVEALRRRGVGVLPGTAAVQALPDSAGEVAAVVLAPVSEDGSANGPGARVPCDVLAVSGGFDPAAQLAVQSGGRLQWSVRHAAFLPVDLPETTVCTGAAAGTRDLPRAMDEAWTAGAASARAAHKEGAVPRAMGVRGDASAIAADTGGLPGGEGGDQGERRTAEPMRLSSVLADGTDRSRVFVDLQRDAALADIDAALDAGMTSIEHVKRRTTIGTGPDQGRTSHIAATAAVARRLGRSMDEVGGTAPRPPTTPIPFAALAARSKGELLEPLRRTPVNAWHAARGAAFEDVGQWRRARYYPRGGEDLRGAVLRECAAVREGVGVLDASTLGAVLVAGRDAGELLDRLSTGAVSTVKPGRSRYQMLCTPDGMVFDDGVVTRLPSGDFQLSTTTGNAERVREWLEEWAQTEWPDLCVHIFDATDHWAVVTLSGPDSRQVMRALAPDMDTSVSGFPFMAMREGNVAGAPARVLRVSFTGELTFEINVPAWYGAAVWGAAMDAGEPLGITPYGTEAMHVLRAEKGFIVVGHETDGNVTPYDLGMQWAVSRRKDFIGTRSLTRPDTARTDREQLVGLLPEDGGVLLAEGAQLIARQDRTGAASPVPVEPIGRVTSSYDSAALGRTFALGLLRSGRERHGERLYAVHLGEASPVLVADPVFYDPQGERRDGRPEEGGGDGTE